MVVVMMQLHLRAPFLTQLFVCVFNCVWYVAIAKELLYFIALLNSYFEVREPKKHTKTGIFIQLNVLACSCTVL